MEKTKWPLWLKVLTGLLSAVPVMLIILFFYFFNPFLIEMDKETTYTYHTLTLVKICQVYGVDYSAEKTEEIKELYCKLDKRNLANGRSYRGDQEAIAATEALCGKNNNKHLNLAVAHMQEAPEIGESNVVLFEFLDKYHYFCFLNGVDKLTGDYEPTTIIIDYLNNNELDYHTLSEGATKNLFLYLWEKNNCEGLDLSSPEIVKILNYNYNSVFEKALQGQGDSDTYKMLELCQTAGINTDDLQKLLVNADYTEVIPACFMQLDLDDIYGTMTYNRLLSGDERLKNNQEFLQNLQKYTDLYLDATLAVLRQCIEDNNIR